MNRKQVLRILKVTMIASAIALIGEIIFSIPQVTDWFGSLITSSSKSIVYLIIGIIMFLQVTILNIPAYVILSACVSIGLNTLSIEFISVVLLSYMLGCLTAYAIGYFWGYKAVVWCAGSKDEYDKWSDVLNTKGKWWYFLTVIFPMFPDDILCLVAGSVRFNIFWYTLFNLIGRCVGLVCMLLVLKLAGVVGGGFPILLVVWAVALIGQIITYCIINKKEKANEFNVDR